MSYKRELERANRNLDAVQAMVDALRKPYFNRSPEQVKQLGKGPSVIEELLRRGQQTPGGDGYPGGGEGGPRGSEVSRPTEAAALRDASPEAKPGRPARPDTWDSDVRDAVGDALVEIATGLSEAYHGMAHADQARGFVMGVQGKVRGRVNTVDLCAHCGDPAVKVKRIDGQPYHATTCYFVVRRARGEWVEEAV